MLETSFWCQYPGFCAWEIHWDHFQTPQIYLNGQMAISGHFWPIGPVITQAEQAKDLILVPIPRFVGMRRSLGPFSG